jgi:hypothetical protein
MLQQCTHTGTARYYQNVRWRAIVERVVGYNNQAVDGAKQIP